MTDLTGAGQLGVAPPAVVLRRLGQEEATGCLRLRTGDTEATVWLRGGLVYTASAPGARARLGDRLVGAGQISEDQLAATLEHQRAMDGRRRIGELLIDSGLIDRETMRTYVREQSADSVALTLGWVDGEWAFDAGAEIDEDVPLDESVENLLMEGARRLEEWEVVQRGLGSVDAVVDFVPSGGTAELSLTPDEWSMLTRIDGVSTVREIACDAGYSEFGAARIIYGLLTAGVVRVVDEDDADTTAEPAAEAEPAAGLPEPGRDVDRNELLREFAALDDDWGIAAPPSTPSAPRSDGAQPAGSPPAPPPVRRPAPPPEEKSKRGLFGRRKKD